MFHLEELSLYFGALGTELETDPYQNLEAICDQFLEH